MNCDPKELLAAAKCYQCVPRAVWGPTVISLLCEWANNMACTFQEGAGSPVGVNTPNFVGQLYHDTTNDTYYRSTGLTNIDWIFIGVGTPFVEWIPHTEVATWNDSGGSGQTGDYATFLATADLSTLSFIELSGTAITSLVCNNCLQLTNIRAATCSGPLTSLDVSGCQALSKLVCPYNSITSIDVSGSHALTLLECGYNALTSLNITGCTVLDRLSCEYNSLTALDVSSCGQLVTLFCSSNLIVALDVSVCPLLDQLTCGYNSLNNLNVTGCSVLTNLSCKNNPLTSLDISTCTSLVTCNASNSSIANINLLGCVALQVLDATYNLLTNGAAGSVNVILSDMVTNNPPAGQIFINYQTPPAPPDAGPPDGATAKATLIGLGWTVTTD